MARQACLARNQCVSNHRDLGRQPARALRRDRNAYSKATAEETESVATCGDNKENFIKCPTVSECEVLFERDGSVIPDKARRLCRWEEHFREFLNDAAPRNAPRSPADTPAAEQYSREVNPPALYTPTKQQRPTGQMPFSYPTYDQDTHVPAVQGGAESTRTLAAEILRQRITLRAGTLYGGKWLRIKYPINCRG